VVAFAPDMHTHARIASVDEQPAQFVRRHRSGIQLLSWHARLVIGCLLCAARSIACGQDAATDQDVAVAPDEATEAVPDEWIDRAHRGLHAMVWRSAMYVDGLFGPQLDEQAYQRETRGSITPALLWDEFHGFDEKFRFRVKLPLPVLGERYDAFVGTFSRDEFVTESEIESGAIPRQHVGGEVEEDETLLGIQYRDPDKGGRFDASAGMRITSPIDPFVKVSYRYKRGTQERLLLRLRETVFWENSEQFGLTSRVDLERVLDEAWLARWTVSGTFSEKSEGVRGYTALTAYRGLPDRRAVGAQVFTEGSFDAAVPVGEYGVRMAYRQSVVRDWLVVEVRPQVTWPKDEPEQPRKPSWGIGIGFEIFFGTDEFQARPVTF
jgi:hypothetical protein